MSIITDISYIDRVEAFTEETDNVGHFAALNLNYNCSSFQIKKSSLSHYNLYLTLLEIMRA